MVGSSSAAPRLPSPSSNFSLHVGPTSLQVITTAASLHLGNFLRRRIHQGFLLPSSSFNFKLLLYLYFGARTSFEERQLLSRPRVCFSPTVGRTSQWQLNQISYLGYFPRLRDVWHERAFPYSSFNILQWSYDAIFGTSISFYFSSGEGNKNDSNHGEKASSQFFSNRRRWTDTLIAVNVAVYIAQIATQGKLLFWGAKINSLIDKGQLWRLVTSSFLHANILHLMVNCYSLRCIGPAVEDFSGPRRYLAVYFTSAIASSAMSYWLCKNPSVGASGAIFGIIGSYALFLSRHKAIIVDGDQHLKDIMRVIAINVGIGFFLKGIDKWGHVGGFIGGVATSWLLGPALKLEYISSDGEKHLMDRPPISTLFKRTRPTE